MPLLDLYINEATPPFHLFLDHPAKMPSSYPPTGIIKKDANTFFDDKELIKQCQAVHIDSVTAFSGTLITGLEVKYRLDQGGQTRKHGSATGKAHSTFEIENKESIIRVQCRVSEKGIHSIELETNAGRIYRAAGSDQSDSIVKFDFRAEGRAVVAFKGCYTDTITALGCYTWKIRLR